MDKKTLVLDLFLIQNIATFLRAPILKNVYGQHEIEKNKKI